MSNDEQAEFFLRKFNRHEYSVPYPHSATRHR
jgi:hypothetical protein